MKFHPAHSAALSVVFAVATAAYSNGALAANDDAAKALMKKDECTKCHAADKDKIGPSYKSVAAKYKGKADAEEKVTKSITTEIKYKAADGTQATHKNVSTKDAKEIKNVVQWILAQ